MKNIIILIALIGSVAFSSAQNVKQRDLSKEGDLIKATYYYDNGTISQEGYYTINGKLQGNWVSYDANGNKTAEAHYENGNKTGKWFFWQNKDILKEVDYKNSEVVAVNTWKIEGERVVSAD